MAEQTHTSTHSGSILVVHHTRERLRAHGEAFQTDHVLTYLVAGWLRMDHSGPVKIEPGTISIIPAGVPHQALEGRDIEYWQVRFCASCLSLDESQLLMSPFREARRGVLPVVTIPESRRWRLEELLSELRAESSRETPESPQLSQALLFLILGEVRRSMTRPDVIAKHGSLVSEALEFVQRRCFDPISLKDVAAAVHRTPAHVTAAVKKSTGYSVGEWIAAGRVAEAAARLVHTDDPIGNIANRVGWQDKTHFIRVFKKAYGATPAAWRRDNRSGHS